MVRIFIKDASSPASGTFILYSATTDPNPTKLLLVIHMDTEAKRNIWCQGLKLQYLYVSNNETTQAMLPHPTPKGVHNH